jgi:serine/threonine protein kinase
MANIEEFLLQLARRTLTQAEAGKKFATFIDAGLMQQEALVRCIEKLRASEKISAEQASMWLAALQGDDGTVLLTRTHDDRSLSIDKTSVLPADVPENNEATLIRPRASADAARIQPPVPDATVAHVREASAPPIHDPTQRIRPANPEAGVVVDAGVPENFPPTLPARDKTQVLSDRLVRSLDDAEEPHRGPVQPGTVVKKRFVLETLLGKGGMGVVFGAIDRRKEEARDPHPYVALKLLNADFARHPQSFVALQREARKAQSLAHPNVATVFDFDRDGDAVYLTMELLEGRSLDAIAREARGVGIGAELALPIIRGVAEGLAYAHRKGIVHSDLKPGNIFLTDDGTPKILDFGIARAVPTPGEQMLDEFDAGSLGAYTEAYATQEMVDGSDPHPADDMYALGIIAYELLTGCHPYQRNSATQARELALKFPPLKGLKRKQARAIESCLSLDRKNRPQDAGEFLKAFRGASVLQRAAIGTAAVFALTASYLGYQNYVENGPSIPFSQLPADRQLEFKQKMSEGDAAWRFYEHDHIGDALDSAIDFYADAYNAHPRNREAVAALNRAADAVLQVTSDPNVRRDLARKLQERSDYYRKYTPVVEAARE